MHIQTASHKRQEILQKYHEFRNIILILDSPIFFTDNYYQISEAGPSARRARWGTGLV